MTWGLWDETREQWVRIGYKTAREAAIARREIEARMDAECETNLQIAKKEHKPPASAAAEES